MASVNLSIIGASGVELPLASSPWDAGVHRVMDGTAGLGLPAQQASFTEAAGDGRRLTAVRTSGRTLSLDIGIFGDSRDAVEAAIDALGDAIAYVDGKPLPRLRATYADGRAVESEFVSLDPTDGLSPMGELVARHKLKLECPDAYWTAVNFSEFIVAQAGDNTGFLESLPNVYLQPSDASGTVTLTNPGKVPSWVNWELVGPFSRVDVVYGTDGFSYTQALTAGQRVLINKTPAGIEVVDAAGASKYPAIADVPRFFQLPPGKSTVTVTMAGTTAASRVIGRYKPRYRQVF
jgi:hypothetical protein